MIFQGKTLVCLLGLLLMGSTLAGAEVEGSQPAPLENIVKPAEVRNIHHYIKLGIWPAGFFDYMAFNDYGRMTYDHSDYMHAFSIQYEFSPLKYIGFETHLDFKGYHYPSTNRSSDTLTRLWGAFGPRAGVGVVFHPIKNRNIDPFINTGLEAGIYYHDFYENIGSAGFGFVASAGCNYFLTKAFFLGTDVVVNYCMYSGTSYTDYERGYPSTVHYYDFNLTEMALRLTLGFAF